MTEKLLSREDTLKLLEGAVVEVGGVHLGSFSGSVQGLVVKTKDGQILNLNVESEAGWEGSTSGWLEVEDAKTRKRYA
jgi:hypothetical protein